ncbi:uncharacterized protein METZ01_LOCUS246111, partial [marine metagenome]
VSFFSTTGIKQHSTAFRGIASIPHKRIAYNNEVKVVIKVKNDNAFLIQLYNTINQ